MTERKYSVAEIDEMRCKLKNKYYPPRNAVIYMFADPRDEADYQMKQQLRKTAMSQDIEEKLRTYMLAGIDPNEL